MTDRFEEAVRQAAQGLGDGGAELPSYQGAWRRGRRRRFAKRGALAAAGVALVATALSVNLDLPGPDSTDTDQVVVPAEAATAEPAPTSLATTAPIETPTSESAVAATAQSGPTPDVVVPTAVETPVAVPTVPPAPDATTTTAPPTAPPTAVPTAVPTAESTTQTAPAPTPEPTAEPTVGATQPSIEDTAPSSPDPTVTPDPFAAPDSTSLTDPAQTGPVDPSEPQAPVAALEARPADAVVLDEQPSATATRSTTSVPCDLDGDASADATCELMANYSCDPGDTPAAGYEAVDLDGDQVVDTCVASGVTVCDTTGDGLGDTPCTIELNPAEPES